jgi:hypothetical protein
VPDILERKQLQDVETTSEIDLLLGVIVLGELFKEYATYPE